MSFDVAIGCLKEYQDIIAARMKVIEADRLKDSTILHKNEYEECVRQFDELERAIAALIFKEQ